MENQTKRYWKGLEELRNDETFVKNAHNEFGSFEANDSTQYKSIVDGIGSDRRDFLKVLGFGLAAVSLAACDAPVKKSIPYLNKPTDTFPSIADWYASTYAEGGDYASVLVKTREGRPIKIEGNKQSSVSKGGVSARAHASLLALYDAEKLKGPKKGEADAEWDTVDKEISAQLASIAAKGGQIRIVSSTILSPSTKAVIADFTAKYPTTQHITYDANSVAGLVKANGDSFGKAIVPSYDFSKAKVIVGLSCDFLGSWIAPHEYSVQYVAGRKLNSGKGGKKDMSRHYQFETTMSLTGANADYRAAVKPSQEGLVALALYNKLSGKGGTSLGADVDKVLDKAVADLKAAQGAALVVSGSNDPNVQVVVNAINSALGAYGTCIDLGTPVYYRQGNDVAMNGLIDNVKAGSIGAVILYGCNPVYDHPRGAELKEALPKVELSVSFADRADETSSLCKYITPAPHYLESWGDAEPKAGFYSLQQPAISLIYKTRQAQSSLLKWSGANPDFYTYLRNYWKANILGGENFEGTWTKALHDGVVEKGAAAAAASAGAVAGLDAAIAAVTASYKASATGLEVVLYEKVGMGTGALANNPWLQEFPEPVTKACWDNYASVSQKTAKELGLSQDDVVKIEVKGKSVELPVLIQPGQANGTISIAIGYGREKAGKAGNGVGVNMYPFIQNKAGFANFSVGEATLTKTGDSHKIAQTQTHETVMGRRAVMQEARLAEYQKDSKAGRYFPHVSTSEGIKSPTEITLWDGYQKPNHSWGMAIDLNSCTGCGACVISCQAENNVSVVGRQEVINRREMHWIRIDRYYSSDADVMDKSLSGSKALEIASDNPEVVFQPLMCQHCGNAPCETVCPVLATTHSTEGLNQMAYNRCVGTRYCANNCPYKVRRFNWFKYFDNDNFDFHYNNDLGKMVINPDVTVRSRGVIEKCSMCVQRIQEGKLNAKKERRRPVDGEIVTACAQSCPTEAIVFGDMNDPASKLSKLLAEEKEGRAFQMLEEINVKPQISYLTKIRNKDVDATKAAAKEAHAEHGGH
ncbi:TAT-variant-translocated molybdopterin oxidoreductase [Runella salmonicolor]|uniref:TAT-variant-translocated molybdopterin oxidoreductase n=1 Tax=Runella salmonicolor TaxID=2950278 RepID=A0ABT1FI65_9BACT|nr:TAT-variant-translocated molybdopterin oxidoreductase [Runella salmonicolor]MCP1381431.1 TAT-variant-translocated molybdopterin oxidoreductase [Runella salmonicolor]